MSEPLAQYTNPKVIEWRMRVKKQGFLQECWDALWFLRNLRNLRNRKSRRNGDVSNRSDIVCKCWKLFHSNYSTQTFYRIFILEKETQQGDPLSLFLMVAEVLLSWNSKRYRNNGIYSLFSNVMCSSVSLLHWLHVCTGNCVLCLKARGSYNQFQNNRIN